MTVAAVATYQPVWATESGDREAGPDEDSITMAVAAGATLLRAHPSMVSRIVLVGRRPATLEGTACPVISLSLGLPQDTPTEMRMGGAPATLDALTTATEGTLVVGVDTEFPAGAAAAIVGESGASLEVTGRIGRSLPMRVQQVGNPSPYVYMDARLERERGWKTALAGLASDQAAVVAVAGVPAAEARRLGYARFADEVPVEGAAAPLFVLAAMSTQRVDGRLVALDSAAAVSAALSGASKMIVACEDLCIVPASQRPTLAIPADVPVSMPAYDRALQSKVGFLAARCACGASSFPPRVHCLNCGEDATTTLEPLPRTGSVYTGVTVHTPVPGLAGPYGLVIVQLDDVDVRVLAKVTDANPENVRIGDRGRLVLRRVAVRQGVADYGYAFQTDRAIAEPIG